MLGVIYETIIDELNLGLEADKDDTIAIKQLDDKSSLSESDEELPSRLPRKIPTKISSESKSDEAVPSILFPKFIVDSTESESSEESPIPLEFPFEKSISIDKFYFEDGIWRLAEKPTVIISEDETATWINTDISHEATTQSLRLNRNHDGIERKDRFLEKIADVRSKSVSDETPDLVLSLLPLDDEIVEKSEEKIVKIEKNPATNEISNDIFHYLDGRPEPILLEDLTAGVDEEEENDETAKATENFMKQITKSFSNIGSIYTKFMRAVATALTLQDRQIIPDGLGILS